MPDEQTQRAAARRDVLGAARLGQPVARCSPLDLEVHPAGSPTRYAGSPGVREAPLPGYVARDHDWVLAKVVSEAAEGRSHMVVLVGSSSTGKTRACWEAVQALAEPGWWLWHPFAPGRAEAALAGLPAVPPCTVVWLNEAQHYLGDPQLGEQIAAGLHGLLTDVGRGPVLIVATLWPELVQQYTALPQPGEGDPHSRVRELLAARMLSVPEAFDDAALRAAAVLAKEGDVLLAGALTRAGTSGRIAQDLAGAPELLRRYRHGSPAAAALLNAAMDARRLGVGPHLPQPFLAEACVDYLEDVDYAQLGDSWVESAFAELTRPVHGKQAPLCRITPRPRHRSPTSAPANPLAANTPALFQLADYLEQHGRATRRRLCPPASFWAAAGQHLSRPDDLDALARAARARYRLRWAEHLARRAAEAGQVRSLLVHAARCEQAADWAQAKALYRRAADAGKARAWPLLAEVHEQAGEPRIAENLAWQAAAAGHVRGLARIAVLREETGDPAGAQALALRAADAGHGQPLQRLTALRHTLGQHEDAEATALLAADHGHPHVLTVLGELREVSGDLASAQALYRQAAEAGHSYALVCLAMLREELHDLDGADDLALQATAAWNPRAVALLSGLHTEAGRQDRAEALCHRAIAAGHSQVLLVLAGLRQRAGDLGGAEALYRQAAEAGHRQALLSVARLREKAGDTPSAETLYRAAADSGDISALTALSALRERAGDPADAEALAWQAADAGAPHVLSRLVAIRRRAGRRQDADILAAQAIDAGYTPRADFRRNSPHPRFPHGLDPDGTPTPPWP
ncbi:hypothetical protein [Streptomyces sp. NPDC057616]|uniref:tetratricopeptide repeat protein n=1 Tax=Streptomyces sp. NPDC057616 TaxID=3346183 RepID=UPI0036A042F6